MAYKLAAAMTVRRLIPFLAVAALALAGCGNKTEVQTHGETEGIYVQVGGLTYQVQISRQLNPANVEDAAYLKGVPWDIAPPNAEETWFAVFLQVFNETDEPLPTAEHFIIKDTAEREYEPVKIDASLNPFAYHARRLVGGELLPNRDSAAYAGPTQGELLLFRLTNESLANRPLELEIESPGGEPKQALVNLDV